MADPVHFADIEALVAEFIASGCAELHIRFDGFELHLASEPQASVAAVLPPSAKSGSVPTPPVEAPAALAPVVAEVPPPAELEGFTIIRAPYLGTFYRAPKPGEPPYVEIDSVVAPETDLCLVEVMKLFTAVRAEVAGRVAKILASDGVMVEAGQPLFAIEVQR